MEDAFEPDRIVPTGAWAFDESVTRVFNDMLRRSIPQYDVMRLAVHDLAAPFVTEDAVVVDLGSSRGDAIASLMGQQDKARFVCVESSQPMVAVLRSRFAAEIAEGTVEVVDGDARSAHPDVVASLTLAVLTLQFIPVADRAAIVRRVFERTRPGGAFIVVEKVRGATPAIDHRMVHLYHRHKLANGYSQEDIDRKALSLEGVLIPATADENVAMLRDAGFAEIDCFWRWMNFAGWLAVRDG